MGTRCAVHGFEIPWLQALLGGGLFLFPGFAWTWALGKPIPVPHRIPLAIVVAFSTTPLVLYFLSYFLHVPVNLGTMAFLAGALGLLGCAVLFTRAVAEGRVRL